MEALESALEYRQFGNRLFFRRVAHPESALMFFRKAVELGDIEALFFIARYMISKGQRGLKKLRAMTLDAVQAAAHTGNRRFLRLFALLQSDLEKYVAGMACAADAGDPIAQYIAGIGARKAWLDSSDVRFLQRSYDLLCKSAASGCVEAMGRLGDYLVIDGQQGVGFDSLLRAASCGCAFAYYALTRAAPACHLTLFSRSFDNFIQDALHRVVTVGDQFSAWVLASFFAGGNRDLVLAVRLVRRGIGFVGAPPFPVLFGERLWASWRSMEVLMYTHFLMIGGKLPNRKRYDFVLKPLVAAPRNEP